MNSNPSYNSQTASDVEARLLELNVEMLRAEEEGQASDIGKHLHSNFKIVRSDLVTVEDRPTFLRNVPKNAKRGRVPELPEVRLFGDRAIYTCLVTTKTGHFWNTRLFVRKDSEWFCLQWQVMKVADREPTNAK